jgi:hypothetical protein
VIRASRVTFAGLLNKRCTLPQIGLRTLAAACAAHITCVTIVTYALRKILDCLLICTVDLRGTFSLCHQPMRTQVLTTSKYGKLYRTVLCTLGLAEHTTNKRRRRFTNLHDSQSFFNADLTFIADSSLEFLYRTPLLLTTYSKQTPH